MGFLPSNDTLCVRKSNKISLEQSGRTLLKDIVFVPRTRRISPYESSWLSTLQPISHDICGAICISLESRDTHVLKRQKWSLGYADVLLNIYLNGITYLLIITRVDISLNNKKRQRKIIYTHILVCDKFLLKEKSMYVVCMFNWMTNEVSKRLSYTSINIMYKSLMWSENGIFFFTLVYMKMINKYNKYNKFDYNKID